LRSLQRDEARLTALLTRLARLARPSPPAPAARGATAPDRPAGSFASRRGTLTMPVRGELASRFGSPRDGGGPPWKGWFIRCAPGQDIKAIASGQVVFADWLRGFGNLLILDHGDGYMSLYGYNDALFAEVGANVREGEPVAQAGASGGNPQPGVYFEIRYQGEAVDPAPWIDSH
jgi:murein hydrolase activator